MRISDWSSDVCSSDLLPRASLFDLCRSPPAPRLDVDRKRVLRVLPRDRKHLLIDIEAGQLVQLLVPFVVFRLLGTRHVLRLFESLVAKEVHFDVIFAEDRQSVV